MLAKLRRYIPRLLFHIYQSLITQSLITYIMQWLRGVMPGNGFSIKFLFSKKELYVALKGHGSIAHSASPHGLLTRSPQGLRV